MERSTNYKVKLGVFVVVGLALFTVGVYMVGKEQNLFSRNIALYAKFKQVNGLQSGSNVRFSGINVGAVSNIEIIDDSTILVSMVIKESVQQFIKLDAVASIGTDGLMGNMLVNISPGGNQTQSIEDGGYLRTYEKVLTEDIINTLNSSNENLAVLIEELLEIAQGVNKGKGTVGVLMKDSLVANDLRHAVKNLNYTTIKAVTIIEKMNTMMDDWQKGDGLVNALMTDTAYVTKIQQTFESLEKASSEIQQTSTQLNTMLEQKHSDNALNTVLRDSIFNANLQKTMVEIKDGATKFNENMEALRTNWFFKKFFKKKNK